MATIGLRAKTARAIAVILTGTAQAPVAVRRAELSFATPATPATFQPFHEVMNLPWQRAQRAVRKAESTLVANASAALGDLVDAARDDGMHICAIGIVGSPDRALEAIASPHIRAHAAEGMLFRRVLERAAEAHQLVWAAYSDRGLADQAVQKLGVTGAALNAVLSRFGREVGRPWRADEKAAALGAWLALAGRDE